MAHNQASNCVVNAMTPRDKRSGRKRKSKYTVMIIDEGNTSYSLQWNVDANSERCFFSFCSFHFHLFGLCLLIYSERCHIIMVKYCNEMYQLRSAKFIVGMVCFGFSNWLSFQFLSLRLPLFNELYHCMFVSRFSFFFSSFSIICLPMQVYYYHHHHYCRPFYAISRILNCYNSVFTILHSTHGINNYI